MCDDSASFAVLKTEVKSRLMSQKSFKNIVRIRIKVKPSQLYQSICAEQHALGSCGYYIRFLSERWATKLFRAGHSRNGRFVGTAAI